MHQNEFAHEKLNVEGRMLAYRHDGPAQATRPGLFFLHGFFSDMTGSKAAFLAQRCVETGRRLTRFDYRGHGLSSGAFIDGCMGDWLDDALAVFDHLTNGPQIIIGSSMGGWIMLLLALQRPERVAGLVGIAAAPDFTEDLIWPELPPPRQREMVERGVIYEPSDYGPSVPYTYKLVEEGRKHLLLRGPIAINAPVRLIQGMQDKDVPWQTAPRIAEKLTGNDVRVILIKDGEHRLSREEDLKLLWEAVEGVG